jgi:SNF2 family DNA or RNA helicase
LSSIAPPKPLRTRRRQSRVERITLHAAMAGNALFLWSEPSSRPSELRERLSGLAHDIVPQRWADAAAGSASTGGIAREGVALEGRDVVAVLQRFAGRELAAPDVALSPDITFWCDALRLAAEIVASQRFLPGLSYDAEQKRYRAVWDPILGDRERKLAASLAATSPAFSTTLERFLTIAVDALVRNGASPSSGGGESNGSPLHDRWLEGLRSSDGSIVATAGELRGLAAQIAAWRRPAIDDAATDYRLCLRLEEPLRDDDPWRVAYLLQSRSDPTLLLDARAASASAPSRRAFLAALGRAAQISPAVEASLHGVEAVPHWFETDAGGAYAFLSESAWLLEQAGIGVIVPSWWLGKNTAGRVVARPNVKPPATSAGLRADTLLDVDWNVVLGDRRLSPSELERLAKLKVPLVRIRGQWVHVDPDDVRTVLARLREGGSTLSLADVVRLHLDGTSPVEAPANVEALIDALQQAGRLRQIEPPAGLRAQLRPYQLRGYAWLQFLTSVGFGACLADDMGLGKTVQMLALIERDRGRTGGRPVLLVCPTSVIENWVREMQRFTPGVSAYVHHGTSRLRGKEFARHARRHDVVITSYALLTRDAEAFASMRWHGVVLDEAQNIKNPDSKQARSARALRAGYRAALTGTPVENHVGDLWSIMEFCNPGLLGSQASFRRDFVIPIHGLHDAGAARRLQRLSGPFVLRRSKRDPAIVADLPDKNEANVYCTLTQEQGTLYAAVLRDLESGIDETKGIARRGAILALLSKLKQICNHPAQFAKDRSAAAERSGKLMRLEEMLEEVLDVGDRALIFTQFAEMGKLLVRRLSERFGREVLFLHGGVPKDARDEMVRRFQEEHGPALFVLSLKAGGSGLNLTRANHVFHYDRWWNPAVENQATDRAFRIGQTKDVQVHKFVCAGTLEERIDDLIARKAAVADTIVGSGEQWLTELSNNELRDLVALSPDAVEE